MHRLMLYQAVDSQIFNDQFEIPILSFLGEMDENSVNNMTDRAFDLLATYLMADNTNVNVILVSIGETVLKSAGRATSNYVEAVGKTGAFFMRCFSLIGLFEVIVEDAEGVFINVDEPKIKKLWDERTKIAAIKPTLYPLKPNLKKLIRRGRAILTKKETPMAVAMIDKLFNRGWVINTNILSIALKHFKDNTQVFKTYYKSSNPVARESKKRLTETIINLGIELQSKVFYHQYFFDFR